MICGQQSRFVAVPTGEQQSFHQFYVNRTVFSCCFKGYLERLKCLADLFLGPSRILWGGWVLREGSRYQIGWIFIFIGPRSDHSLPMSLTDWLTNLLKIEWFDHCWLGKLSKTSWRILSVKGVPPPPPLAENHFSKKNLAEMGGTSPP